MREIKFRAKGQTDEKWHYGLLVFISDMVCKIKDKYATWICDAETIGQYTGLKDKDGKEIYEGDIVKAFCLYDKFEFSGEIMFGNASFYILDACISHYRWMDYEVEVIGNIQNKDLIEQ